jgi:hypothetical protein
MKRKIIYFVMMLALTGLVTMQSCKKEESKPPKEFVAAMPDAPVPAVAAIIPFTGAGQIVNLSWTGTATNAVKWDVYFGTSSTPALVVSGVTSNAYAATLQTGGAYYWQVRTIDANNVRTESPVWSFEVNSNPAAPSNPVPAINATSVSCSPTLSWTATDPDGDALTYDLYLDNTTTPTTIVATGLTDPEFVEAATLTATADYYWKVVAHDPFGGQSVSPVWKFTTGSLPISVFTGNYNVDEPAEAYSYGVSFTFVSASTIKTTNYWNSGWTAIFTIDLTKLTYTMSSYTFSAGWTGVESGIIDMTTGKMTGTYTLWLNNVIQEQGVHTYTKL